MSPTVFKNISAKEAVFSETISIVPDLRNNPSILVPPVSYQPTTHVTNSNTKTPLCHPILNIFSKLRFEIACFSFTVALLISQSSSTSMILEKTCLSKYSEDICGNLKNYTEIKSSVEQAAVNYQLIHTLIQTVPAVIVSLFIGSWSDKYGRKLPLQIALLGAIIEAVLSCICAYYRHSRVEYYFIPAIFMGCMGGGAALLTIVYSYTSESVGHEKRTMKNAFFEIAIGLAKPVGVMAGGWIYNFWGYVAVFAIAACGLFFSLLWFTFMIPETRGLDNTDPWTVKAKQFVSCRNVTESFTLKVKQESQSRKKIVLLIISICILHISSSASTATAEVNYMYAHHQFNWGNTTYSTITSSYLVLTIIALIIITACLKRFNAADTTIGIIGIISNFTRLVGIGVAWTPIVYHIANVLGLVQGCGPIAGRSCLSKSVANEDLGKVFSLVAITESILPIVTLIIFSQIFNAFLDIFPGTPYILLAAVIIVPFSVFIWLSRKLKENYEDIPGKNEWNTKNIPTISKM
ncbi:Proton-coupled folate transporter like protein [Argiope bruennichi]|uniref:Proton-coupled folate transporter like protein n=1 Tax=Argiope bruennichi TaxID=94029 RepID=A0A8T0E3Z4_ARGBR|nr:Proton-coupled folate transporter like protein [Argiope bruennichi]